MFDVLVGGRWGVPWDGLTRSGATSGHIERGVLDNDSEATEGCKHETILVEYVLNVNGDPRKMQPLIILSLICTVHPSFV